MEIADAEFQAQSHGGMIRNMSRFWYALALMAVGAAGALAMPPWGQWWILAPVFSFFVYAETQRNSQTSLSRFAAGWLFGLGYFLAVLQWISNAFFVDAQNDLWMMPFAVGGLSALLAMFWGIANIGVFYLKRLGVSELWSLPLSLGLAEFARGHVLTGFPWAVPGLAVDGMGGVAQAASLIGMNGLTFFVLAWAVAPVIFIMKLRHSYIEAALVLAILPALWIWGNGREANSTQEFVPGVTLRLVQPNVPQNEKWREGNAPKIWNTLLSLTKQAPADNAAAPTHVIWPESSVPFLLDESSEAKDDLQAALAGSKVLLAGAVRRQRDPTSGRDNYFTSVEIYDAGANLVGKYDKWHLVPGGEFLPMAWLLEPLGLRRLVNLPESFVAGSGPLSLPVPGAGIAAPSICYEAIFPEAFSLSTRPDWFVNVTNDGWFGDSAGPHQHLAQLRLRAIEQGVPIARAANTGISAVIDPVGRYVMRSAINVAGAFDVGLPKPISATVFSRWGFVLQFVLPLFIVIVTATKRRPNYSIRAAFYRLRFCNF